MGLKLLVIDDSPEALELINAYLADEDYQLTMLDDGHKAMDFLRKNQVDIVLTDICIPGISGAELLPFILALYPNLPVIVMTGFASGDGAGEFIRRGAFDYVTKPFTKDLLLHRLHLAAKQVSLYHEVDKLKDSSNAMAGILGNHPALLRITSVLPTISKTDAPVLVLGDSGTGKEVIARAVHSLSNRANNKFVALNCGALPEQLLESELFGYKKGAFTDAKQDRIGLVDEANHGTLFLDEVGEMSLPMQVKFLRFLQEREYTPLGSTVTKKADVRIISATNQDLLKRVRERSFREDLYYRLNVIPLQLPPLKERPTDIPILVDHYVKQFAAQYNRQIKGVSPELMSALMAYNWPGNIRELINTVQRLVIMSTTPIIQVASLDVINILGNYNSKADSFKFNNTPAVDANYYGSPDKPLDTFKVEKERIVSSFERGYVSRLLNENDGNISAATRHAGMDRKNFWQLMKKYGIKAKPNEGGADSPLQG